MAESIYVTNSSLAPHSDPAQRKQGFNFLQYLRSDPPGGWTDNRYVQAQHYRGVPYIAIDCIMALVRGSSFEFLKKKKRDRNRSTFGPGLTKALPTPQQRGQDEDYTPFADEDFVPSRLVSRPNGSETFGEFAAKLVLQNKLTGVGPVWAVPNADGKPVELWALKTPLLYPLWQRTQDYPNGAWRVTPYAPVGWQGATPGGLSMAGALLPGEEVKRFMSPHPFLDWDGFSSLSAGARELDVLDSIEESRKAAMDNGLQLDAMLIVPGLDADEARKLQKDMTERQGGSRNSRRFGVVAPPGGLNDKFDLKTFGQSVRDMDFPNGWDQHVKFVLALFGVPASVAGLSNDTSYSERYAARQQFHDSQENFLECLGTFFTKVICWPWCSFAGEYLVRIRPKPIDDKELAEKVHARQLQNQTITLNESRAKDDLPPLAGGDVPADLYWQMKQQELMPQQMPGMEGMPGQPGAGGDPLAQLLGGGQAGGGGTEEDLQNTVAQEALASLGVPADEGAEGGGEEADPLEALFAGVGKAMGDAPKSGIFTDRRGHKYRIENGKRVPVGGAGAPGAKTPGAAPDYGAVAERLKGDKGAVVLTTPGGTQHKVRNGDDLREFVADGGKLPGGVMPGAARTPGKPPPLPTGYGKPAQSTPAVPGGTSPVKPGGGAPKIAQAAASTPNGKDVLARAAEWADRMADQHADRVAAHLGISRSSARYMLADTIKRLCKEALAHGGTASVALPGREGSGKKVSLTVNRKQGGPTAGAAPKPANPMSEGSLPPRVGKRLARRVMRKALAQLEG